VVGFEHPRVSEEEPMEPCVFFGGAGFHNSRSTAYAHPSVLVGRSVSRYAGVSYPVHRFAHRELSSPGAPRGFTVLVSDAPMLSGVPQCPVPTSRSI